MTSGRYRVRPGVFQLRVLAIIVEADTRISIAEIRRRLGPEPNLDNNKVGLATDRLLHLGLVEEHFNGDEAVYEAAASGRSLRYE